MGVRKDICLTAILCLTATAAGAALNRPVTVSPGGISRVVATAARCPTFSWGGVDRAHGYEIVAYELAAAHGTPEAVAGRRPTLRVTVPGSASSWTPAADQCLAGETSYVWFLRALGRDETVSEWSEGGMFRTPAMTETAGLREEILQIVERYLAAPSESSSRSPQEIIDGPAVIAVAPPKPPAGSPLSGPATARGPDPLGTPALRAELPDTGGSTTYGVYGVSHSSDDGSAGVAGYASATSGEVGGLAGFNDSVQGYGVYGENSGTTGGVGVMGRDEATSGITSGVVGLTENEEGYGGFFWNGDGGDALVVADPALHPVSIDVKLFVDVDGNLGLVGVVQFDPTDWPTEGCEAATEGSIYYDRSDHWLCVCTRTGTGPDTWGYRRADDPTDDCSSPAP